MSRTSVADSNDAGPLSRSSEPLFETLAVVGIGLLGGSVALAAKQRGVVRRVIGVGRNATRLADAREANVIDEANVDLRSAAVQADLLIFATPVDSIVSGVREAAATARAGTIITDVGSTKARICRELSNGLPSGVTFVGSHPLAGSHQQGWEHARWDLFARRVCVVAAPQPAGSGQQAAGREGTVIPPPSAICHLPSAEATAKIVQFWRALGMRVIEMSAEAHDCAVAQTSHVPHVVASAMARTLDDVNRDLVATGFADSTRIAAGDAHVWVPILLDNADAVLARLDDFSAELIAFRDALARRDSDCLRQLWERGKAARDSLSARRTDE